MVSESDLDFDRVSSLGYIDVNKIELIGIHCAKDQLKVLSIKASRFFTEYDASNSSRNRISYCLDAVRIP
jgi:hypothetical protein